MLQSLTVLDTYTASQTITRSFLKSWNILLHSQYFKHVVDPNSLQYTCCLLVDKNARASAGLKLIQNEFVVHYKTPHVTANVIDTSGNGSPSNEHH